jgi:hypothetical protein
MPGISSKRGGHLWRPLLRQVNTLSNLRENKSWACFWLVASKLTEAPFVKQSGMAKEATVRIMRHLLQPDVVQKSLWKGQNSCFNIFWRNCFGNSNTELLSRLGQQLLFSRGDICSTASNQPVGEQTQQQYLTLEHLSGLAKYQRQPTQPQKMWWIPHTTL